MVSNNSILNGQNNNLPDGWIRIKLGDVIDYTKGFAFKSKDYTKNGIRIIRVSDTTANSITDENAIYLDINSASKYSNWRVNEDDIIISTVGSKPPMYDSLVGKAIIISKRYEGSLLNQNAVILKSNIINNRLIYENLRTKDYIKHIEKIFRGNANQASITIKELLEFEFVAPKNQNEQKAIATALSDMDDLILSLEKLIDKKKMIKEGAMEELLTGKKRLDGFNEEWVKCKLGEIAEVVTGTTPSTNDSKNYGDEYMFVSPIDLGKQKYIISTEKMLSQKGFSISRKYPKGSILFTCIGSTIGKSGIASEELSSNQQINAIFPNSSYVTDFMYYMLNYLAPSIKASASEQAVPIINKSTFEKVELNFPKYKEQEAIATILSDMDGEIEKLEKKLDKYKNIKSGMMEELLTGKRRLI